MAGQGVRPAATLAPAVAGMVMTGATRSYEHAAERLGGHIPGEHLTMRCHCQKRRRAADSRFAMRGHRLDRGQDVRHPDLGNLRAPADLPQGRRLPVRTARPVTGSPCRPTRRARHDPARRHRRRTARPRRFPGRPGSCRAQRGRLVIPLPPLACASSATRSQHWPAGASSAETRRTAPARGNSSTPAHLPACCRLVRSS